MCLIVSGKSKIRRSNKERVYYKVLRKDGEQLRAPYFGSTYEIGVVAHSSKPLKFEVVDEDLYFPRYKSVFMVEEGLHCFYNIEDALWCLAEINFASDGKYVLAECKIPVGAHYIEGKTLGGTKSIVSDKLIVERIF